MATITVHDDDPEDISCICGLIDPDIEGILLGYGKESNKELEDELVRECDKQELLNAREKIFDLSKEKVLKCLNAKTAGKAQGEDDGTDTDEEAALLRSYVNKWQMVPRRAERKIVHDIIELIDFTLGSDVTYPNKIVKEVSMNKGNIGEDINVTDLIARLKEDVNAANGQVDIRIIEDKGDKQIHSISIPIPSSDDVTTTQCTVGQPLTKKAVAKDNNAADEANVSTGPNKSKVATQGTDAQPQAIKVVSSGNSVTSDAKKKVGADKSKDTTESRDSAQCIIRVLSESSREIRTCTCAIGIKKTVKDMGSQTDALIPVSQAEFEYQANAVERKIRVNEQNIKGFLKWKSLVNNRFRDVEKAHEREVIAIRAQYRSLAVEMAEFKAKQNRAQPQRGNAAPSTRGIEIMDTGERDEYQQDGNDESIWGLPNGQSTPAATKQNKGAAAQAKAKKARQEKAKQATNNVPSVSNPGKGNGNRPAKNSVAQNKRVTRGDQQAYIVDIEMTSEDIDCTQITSSSDSEVDLPEQKKQRRREGRSDGGATKTGPTGAEGEGQGSLSSRLRAIAESNNENTVEMSDYDSSWAEMDEEPMATDQMEERAPNKQPMQVENTKNGPVSGKYVRFEDDEAKRGTKRSGGAQPGGKKRNERRQERVPTDSEAENSDNSENDSFADKVEKNPWKKVSYQDVNNRKRKEMEASKKRNLKGVKSVLQKEIYIQGLAYEGFANYAEMEELVHDYLVKRGISVIFMKVIPAKFDPTQVGCKVAVREEDFQWVIQDCFWPEDVSVREWRRKPKGGNGYEGYGDNGY